MVCTRGLAAPHFRTLARRPVPRPLEGLGGDISSVNASSSSLNSGGFVAAAREKSKGLKPRGSTSSHDFFPYQPEHVDGLAGGSGKKEKKKNKQVDLR